MSAKSAKQFLEEHGLADRYLEYAANTGTVELAASAIGCAPEHIAKTLSFLGPDGPFLVVMAGDARIHNAAFKKQFAVKKACMIPPQDVERLTGHPVGGVSPFGVLPGVPVHLDESLRRFETIYPAAGSTHNAAAITPDELAEVLGVTEWVCVSKGWQDA